MFKRVRKLEVSKDRVKIDIRENADQSVVFGFLSYDTGIFGLLVRLLFGKYNRLTLTNNYIKYSRKDAIMIDESLSELQSIEYSSISSSFTFTKELETTTFSIEELKPKFEEHQQIKEAVIIIEKEKAYNPT